MSGTSGRFARGACSFFFLDCLLLGDGVFILPRCSFQLCTPGRCFVHQTLSFMDKSSLVMVSVGLVELVPKDNISILSDQIRSDFFFFFFFKGRWGCIAL